MKKLILILVVTSSMNVFSQNREITQLEDLKDKISQEIVVLNDSIRRIDLQIAKIKSSEIKSMISDSSFIATVIKGAKLKTSPSYMAEPIQTLTEDMQVTILDYSNDYFGVCSDSFCGYMSPVWIVKNERIKEYVKLKKEEEKELKRLASEDELAKMEKKYRAKYGDATYNKLRKRTIWIGMSREMATISRGSPNDINRTVGSWGVHEQWVYDYINLYFENGRLTSYQD